MVDWGEDGRRDSGRAPASPAPRRRAPPLITRHSSRATQSRVALFVPCYVDQFYPDVAVATLDLLEDLGLSVEFPAAQTCCGQPMSNAGFAAEARSAAARFDDVFGAFEYVVCPSASCVAMVRHQYPLLLGAASVAAGGTRVFELCEFLTAVLGVESIGGRFPHRVALHQSCHGLREIGLGAASETGGAGPDLVRDLLSGLEGVEIVALQRPDECCGFGGTFAVDEDAVSAMMGRDRVRDHEQSGAEIVTSVDMSCLMHLEGIVRRKGSGPRMMHVAEILLAARRGAR